MAPTLSILLLLVPLAVDCRKVLVDVGKPKASFNDSSTEIELDMSPELLKILTTDDESLAPLLKHAGERAEKFFPVPVWLKMLALKKGGPSFDPAKIKWEDLNYDSRTRLLKDVTRIREVRFFQDREFHGLKIKDDLPLGVPGKFTGPIEYRDDNSIENVDGLETHYRTPSSAGSAILETWKALASVSLPKTYLHAHITSNPEKDSPRLIQLPPDFTAFLYADFLRRVNLIAEFITIMEDRGNIYRLGDEESIYFAPLSQEALLGALAQYGFGFSDMRLGTSMKVDSERLTGWVAPTFWGKYDDDNLIGIEYRPIDDETEPHVAKVILDAIQKTFTSGTLGLSSVALREMKELYDNVPSGKKDLILSQSHYHSRSVNSSDFIWNWLTPRRIEKFNSFALRNVEDPVNQEHLEVRLLYFDFRSDPYLVALFGIDHPVFNRIERAQKAAMKKLTSYSKTPSYKEINLIMRRFLESSGVYDLYLKSIGVERRDLKKSSTSPASPRQREPWTRP